MKFRVKLVGNNKAAALERPEKRRNEVEQFLRAVRLLAELQLGAVQLDSSVR